MTKEHAHTKNEERYEEARALVIREQVATVTLLVQHMDIGYPRALMILNLLEIDGVISRVNNYATGPGKVLLRG